MGEVCINSPHSLFLRISNRLCSTTVVLPPVQTVASVMFCPQFDQISKTSVETTNAHSLVLHSVNASFLLSLNMDYLSNSGLHLLEFLIKLNSSLQTYLELTVKKKKMNAVHHICKNWTKHLCTYLAWFEFFVELLNSTNLCITVAEYVTGKNSCEMS